MLSAHMYGPSHRIGSTASVSLLVVLGQAHSPAALAQSDRPETAHLLLAGTAMAVPTYFIGVATHEGSHALTAVLAGATVQEFRVLPSRDAGSGVFYFGYVNYVGEISPAAQTLFYLAPKITDAALLGTYAALVFTGALPENRYGQLALAVLATGFWVDFSKDIPAFTPHADMVKAYRRIGLESEWARLPLRVLHAGLSAGAAYVVYRGFRGVFRDRDAVDMMALPIWRATF
jgi:hypothetical protein